MADVIFWGATGQAKGLHEAIAGSGFRLVALVDNRKIASPWPEIPILLGSSGLDAFLARRGEINSALWAAVAIGGGNGKDRLMLMDLLKAKGLSILTVIHKRAFLAMDSQVGEGCQILANASVCTHVRLGRGVIVNTAASVDHDCSLGNGVHIAPGATLAGEIEVGDCAFIGTGATVLPGLKVGQGCVVGAGAVVTRNVDPFTTVAGVPARPLKK